MTVTTEAEILSCLRDNLRGAAEDCDLLAKLPAQGPTFVRMRKRLKTVENACRQMAHWREDTRWLPIGVMMEGAHQRSRHWIADHYPRPLFLKLAANLRMLQKVAEDLETKATGRTGTILPEVQPLDRETRPVQVMTPQRSSLILPEGYSTIH